MGWGPKLITPGVPQAKVRYGPVGTPAPLLIPIATAPATAGVSSPTPEAVSGGNTQVIGAPAALVGMPAPSTTEFVAGGGSTPLEAQPGMWGYQVAANERYVTPPSNTRITPMIRPPKFVDPPIAGTGGVQVNTQPAVFARGGKPRGAYVPTPWVTASPLVVTRWSVYGQSVSGPGGPNS